MTRKTAKDFTLTNQDGKPFNLYSNLDKNVLLVFYPKDNSLVCSRQLKHYSDSKQNFLNAGIRIVGINNAPPEEHYLFCNDRQLGIILLSDPGMNVIKDYDALYPLNMIKRKLVLISTDKRVVFEKVLFPYTYWKNDKILDYLVQNQLI